MRFVLRAEQRAKAEVKTVWDLEDQNVALRARTQGKGVRANGVLRVRTDDGTEGQKRGVWGSEEREVLKFKTRE